MNRNLAALFVFLFIAALLPPGEAESVTAEAESAAAESAETSNPLKRLGRRIGQAWESDQYEFYLPVHTWHNRFMYDSSKIREKGYNEQPWGFGIGRGFLDEDGDSHGLYLMGFMDSNDRFQPMLGYNFIKNWYLDEGRDWSVGLGYTLGITARHEYDYIPIPLPLPIFSVRFKNLAVQAAYVPGPYNEGNVLFTWLRWHMD